MGCRRSRAQAELLRFGRRADGAIVPANVGRDVHGRTAYSCPLRACLEQALKRRAFARAFGSGRQRVGVLDTHVDALLAATVDQLQREIDLLGRSSLNPQDHPRRRGLERLLSQLSSQPHAPERRASTRGPAATDDRQPPTSTGGAPSHG